MWCSIKNGLMSNYWPRYVHGHNAGLHNSCMETTAWWSTCLDCKPRLPECHLDKLPAPEDWVGASIYIGFELTAV